MRKFRLAAATALVAISLTVPAWALGAGSASTTSQITPTAPARLTSTPPKTGQLPDTGYDLLPETALGLLLLGAGLAVRLRHSRARL